MSFLKKLTEPQRKLIERLLREDRLTLNEMLDEIRAEFPVESIPSRSALGRAKKNFAEHARRMREVQAAAEVLVTELGEDKDDKAGAFMVQGITTLINNLVLDRLAGDEEDPNASIELSIKDAYKAVIPIPSPQLVEIIYPTFLSSNLIYAPPVTLIDKSL